jgi:hypothetical protein
MRSVQELIALGKVPGDTKQANDNAGYPNGWPIFTNLSDQVKFDYENLPVDRFKALKNGTEYSAALEKMFTPATDAAPTTGAEVPAAVSPEEQIINPTPAAAVVPAEEVVVPETATPAEEVGTVTEYPGIGKITKTKTGWEARIDNGDGSGVQVWNSKTKDELLGKLLQSQSHASRKIRAQELEKQRLLLDEPADPAPVRKTLQPRQLTADEQFEYAEAMASGDPTRVHKAQEKWNAIRNGGTPEEIAGRIKESEDALAVESYKAIAKSFMKQNEHEVVFTHELGDSIDEVLLANNWAYTVRNLNKVLAQLKTEGKVQLKSSTPAEEVELPTPTSAAAPAVPATVVETPRVPPVTTPAAATRLRPGSASTGISPRQTAVRQGQQPVAPVGLTAEEYNRMSVSETRQKYKTDAGFAKAVDKLIAEGKI